MPNLWLKIPPVDALISYAAHQGGGIFSEEGMKEGTAINKSIRFTSNKAICYSNHAFLSKELKAQISAFYISCSVWFLSHILVMRNCFNSDREKKERGGEPWPYTQVEDGDVWIFMFQLQSWGEIKKKKNRQ